MDGLKAVAQELRNHEIAMEAEDCSEKERLMSVAIHSELHLHIQLQQSQNYS